jgi:hypothetical protein
MLFIILSVVFIVAFLVIAHMAVRPSSTFAGEAFAFQRYLGVSEECMSECTAKCSEKLPEQAQVMPVIEAGPADEAAACIATGEGSGTNAPMCQRGAHIRAITECSNKGYSTTGCADTGKTWNEQTRRCTVTVSCPNKE